MSDVGGIRGNQPLGTVEELGKTGTTGTTGSGGVSTTPPPIGTAPDAPGALTAPPLGAPTLGADEAQEHLTSLMGKLGVGSGGEDTEFDFESMVTQLEGEQRKAREGQMKGQALGIKLAQQKAEDNTKKIMAKLDDIQREMDKKSVWDIFGKVFKWVAAIAGLIGGLVTGGATAVLAVAAMVVMVASDDDLGKALGAGGALGVKALMAAGVSKEDAEKGLFWTGVALTVLSVASAARTLYLAYKAGSVGAQLAAGGAKATKIITSGIGGAAQMGSGATTIGSAYKQSDVDNLSQDRSKLERTSLRIQKEHDEMIKKLRELVEIMEAGTQAVLQILATKQDSDAVVMRTALKS
jgi:hypothetical protein